LRPLRRCPAEYSESSVRRSGVTAGRHPLVVLPVVQSLSGRLVPCYPLHDPAAPSALASTLRNSSRRPSSSGLSSTNDASSLRLGLTSRVLTRLTLVSRLPEGPHQPTPLMDFASLQHMPAKRIHLPQAVPDPLRSASRVWLPSWRFPPRFAWPGISQPGSAHGISPFEAFPAHRVARHFRAAPHLPAVTRRIHAPYTRHGTSTAGLDFQALPPASVPGSPTRYSPAANWMLPWVSRPPGFSIAERAERLSPPGSPHALLRRQAAPAPQGIDTHATGLTR